MSIRPDMIGIVVRDIETSLRFYRLLGLDVTSPKKDEHYVEVTTPNGYRISWNALSMVKDIDPSWIEPVGHRMELAFLCDSPSEVDATYAEARSRGLQGTQGSVGCVLGTTVRDRHGPRWQPSESFRASRGQG
jgi:hypothetical protein